MFKYLPLEATLKVSISRLLDMAIKTYKKGKPITYRYTKNGTFHALIAGNISALTAVGEAATSTNFQDQLVSLNALSNSVEILGEYAFAGCYRLSSANVGVGLKTIEGHAFEGCTSLDMIELPQSLETIGSEAMAGCRKLDLMTFNYLDSDGEQLTSRASEY